MEKKKKRNLKQMKEKNKKHQSKKQIKIGVGDEEIRVVTKAKEKSERHKVGRENCGPFFMGFSSSVVLCCLSLSIPWRPTSPHLHPHPDPLW
jgi:hypothetical protein